MRNESRPEALRHVNFCRFADLGVPSTGVKLETLDKYARRHHGLVTREVAAQLGVSRAAWYRALRKGELESLYPAVARLWGSPTTLYQRALAAVWATGPGAMASHRTAAALWGVERPENDPIDVTMPTRERYSRLDEIVVHRPRDLVDLGPIMRFGVPSTNPMRMLIDLGAVDPTAVQPAMMSILASRSASPIAIRGAFLRHARKGRNGITPMRLALESWLGEEAPPDSLLETKMAELIAVYRLPAVEFHAMAAGYEVDFLVVGTRIVLECDGWGSHGLDRDQFEFDRLRNDDLLAAGYITSHFTWRQLTSNPARIAKRIRGVVDRWACP